MPNISPPEVHQLDVVAVDENTLTLASSGTQYKATYVPPEGKPLKEKDVLMVVNRQPYSLVAKRVVNNDLDDGIYNLVFIS